MPVRKCTNCDYEIKDDSFEFCPMCGETLDNEEEEEEEGD